MGMLLSLLKPNECVLDLMKSMQTCLKSVLLITRGFGRLDPVPLFSSGKGHVFPALCSSEQAPAGTKTLSANPFPESRINFSPAAPLNILLGLFSRPSNVL